MNTRVLERRPAGALGRIGVVAGLHVAVIYLVATGLGIVPKLEMPKEMYGTVIDEPRPPDDPPPPVEPEVVDRREIIVPTPEFVPIDPDVTANSIAAVANDDPPLVPPVDVVPQPQVRGVRLDPKYPLTQPAYPAASVRGNQEGVVEIEVFVLPNGRVGDARIHRSTGHALLDQAAIDEAKRRWRLLPATRDGEPFAQWHRLRVVFELKNR